MPPEELAEAKAFLSWLANDHYTLLAYRCHDLVVVDGEDALQDRPRIEPGIPARSTDAERRDELLGVAAGGSRVRARSRPPDRHQGQRALDRAPAGLSRLRRHQALRRRGQRVRRAPLSRPLHVDRVQREPGGHPAPAPQDGQRHRPRGRRAAAATPARRCATSSPHYPRDELFQTSEDDLLRTATGILHLGERQRFRLFVRRDPFERFLVCLIYAPRENYTTELREKWQAILLEAFNGTSSEFNVHLSESVLARVMITVRTAPGKIPQFDVRELEARLALAARRWDDDLKDALIDALGEARGNELLRRFAAALPAAYREDFSAARGGARHRDDGAALDARIRSG